MSNDQSISSQAQSSVRRWIIALKVFLVLVIVPPLFGLVGTVLAMVRAFDTLEMPEGSDPEALSESISLALTSTAFGLMVSFPALILLVLSVIGLARAKRRLRSAG